MKIPTKMNQSNEHLECEVDPQNYNDVFIKQELNENLDEFDQEAFETNQSANELNIQGFTCIKCLENFQYEAGEDLDNFVEVLKHHLMSKCELLEVPAQDETFDSTEDISDFKTEPQFEEEEKNLDETFDDFSDNSSQPPPAKKIKSEFQFVDVPSKNSKTKRKPDGKVHKCGECNKTFKHGFTLKSHIKTIHQELEKASCEFCQKTFNHKSNMRQHLREKHDIMEVFNCDFCTKAFETSTELKLHCESKHFGKGKAHKCEYCEATFGQKNQLDRHMNMDHGVKAYQCDECQKTFTRPQDLRNHISSIHKGEKRWKCDQCEESFGFKKSLRRHVDIVHRGIIYKCDQCDSSFLDGKTLQKHIAISHEGWKPHQCDHCEAAFGFKRELSRHTKEFHFEAYRKK